MERRGPDTPGGGLRGRGVDVAAWVAVIAVIIGLSAGIAWLLSQSRFEIGDIRFEDRVVEHTLIPPAAPPASVPPADVPPSRLPPPPTVGPDGEIVNSPVWVRRPAPDYPVLAMRRGVESGAVTLLCEALASGEIGACEVLREDPAGVGFAQAALAGARAGRVKPRSIDGFETDSTIRFTIRFRLAPEP